MSDSMRTVSTWSRSVLVAILAMGLNAASEALETQSIDPVEGLRRAAESDPLDEASARTALGQYFEMRRAEAGESVAAVLFHDSVLGRLILFGKGREVLDVLEAHAASDEGRILARYYLTRGYRRLSSSPAEIVVFHAMTSNAFSALEPGELVSLFAGVLEWTAAHPDSRSYEARTVVANALARVGTGEAFDVLDGIRGEFEVSLGLVDRLAACPNDRAPEWLLYILDQCDRLFGPEGATSDLGEKALRSREALALAARRRCLGALVGDLSRDGLKQLDCSGWTPLEKGARGVDHWSFERLAFIRRELGLRAREFKALGLEKDLKQTIEELKAVALERGQSASGSQAIESPR